MSWIESDNTAMYDALDRNRQQQIDALIHQLLEEQRDEQDAGATS